LRISRISITNFRSIQHLEEDLPQVCALVGPNNSGKSNILEAIQRVVGRDWVSAGSFNEDDVFARDATKDILIRLTFDPPLSYKKFAYSNEVQVSTFTYEYTRYQIGAEKGQRRLEQKCFDAKGKPPMILAKAPKVGEAHQYAPLVNIPSELRDAIPVIFIGAGRSVKDQLPTARASLLRVLLEDISHDFQDPSHVVEVQSDSGKKKISLRDRFGQLMGQVLDLLHTKQFTELESSIKANALRQLGFDPKTDSDKLDFYFAPFETMDFYKSLELRVKEFGTSISATELGEGFQNAIVLSILQAFEERKKKGAILLLEEPEMFLHPQMQRALYKTLREIGKNNQVIYTTHSPHFVSIPEYDEVLMVRKSMKGTDLVRSKIPVTEKRREKFIKELDPERNELFFAKRLLLVEGDTEKLALPEYARRLTYDLDRQGSTIVEVGGKRNLPEFLALAESFRIPVGVLYDEDSSDFEKDKKEQEIAFNDALDKAEKKDGSVRVWRLVKRYEDHLRKALGEEKYQHMCQKHSVPKPSRARLIAQEDLPIPDPIPEILKWLANPGPVAPAAVAGAAEPVTAQIAAKVPPVGN
jgi:putative ATP-dependent endonuclease of the OLD family